MHATFFLHYLSEDVFVFRVFSKIASVADLPIDKDLSLEKHD